MLRHSVSEKSTIESSFSYRFIDLFAGIGGFHLAFHRNGCECVFASEIDKFARKTYEYNFKSISPNLFNSGNFNDDILEIEPKDIPNFDILCAGFPCQPFSQAGLKKGFNELKQDRGNMFFVLAKIIKEKRPKAFFLENVRHLLNHDSGKTFQVIKQILEDDLGYNFYYQICKASDYGLPQHRPRLYMVGFRKEDNYPLPFTFPKKIPLNFTMSDVFGGKCDKDIGFTLRVGGRGSKFGDRRNWEYYLVNGEVKRISEKEGKMMMGFPETYKFPVGEKQTMKQLGNSVAVNAVQSVAHSIVQYLKTEGKEIKYVPNFEEGLFALSLEG